MVINQIRQLHGQLIEVSMRADLMSSKVENAPERIVDAQGQLERVKGGVVQQIEEMREAKQDAQHFTERCRKHFDEMTSLEAELQVDSQHQSQRCHDVSDVCQSLTQRIAFLEGE